VTARAFRVRDANGFEFMKELLRVKMMKSMIDRSFVIKFNFMFRLNFCQSYFKEHFHEFHTLVKYCSVLPILIYDYCISREHFTCVNYVVV
jgi:hypothetical protein